MPEGDTIHRAAAALRTALVGQPLVTFTAPYIDGVRPSVGRVIERIDSHGKHLEFEWDDGIVLHSHMRMSGSWHLYHPNERWRRPQREMVVSIEVPEWHAVCFNAPTVETYRRFDKRRHPVAGHLGPDLCKDGPDIAECLSRIDRFLDPGEPLSEVMLDQRIACGVGNVYKSEILWRMGMSPFAPIGSLSTEERRELLETAAEMMRYNRDRVRRVTAPGVAAGAAVYGRHGMACPRCHDTIRVRKTGPYLRATYWCPTCQPGNAATPAMEVTPSGLVRPMVADPHPAAVIFMADLPTRKVQFFDDEAV